MRFPLFVGDIEMEFSTPSELIWTIISGLIQGIWLLVCSGCRGEGMGRGRHVFGTAGVPRPCGSDLNRLVSLPAEGIHRKRRY